MRRINRFTAEVLINDEPRIVHVRNTGRLKELLTPHALVTLQVADDPNRKTAFDLISVFKPELKWVNIDSLVPNILIRNYLSDQDFDTVNPEYTLGDSRFDFYMECNSEKYLTEVKGCTLVADLDNGIGLFPDAPTERGLKHVKELAGAVKEGYHCSIAFVIQMNGIHLVLPNNKTQPEFGQALIEAARAGVQIFCYSCYAQSDSIVLTGIEEATERYICGDIRLSSEN